MKIINIEQGSAAWKEARKKIIGASDCSVILGINPWKNKMQLYREKMGEVEPKIDSQTEFLFNKGHAVEAVARTLFENESGIKIIPMVIAHGELEWAQASLDGINLEKQMLVEIKYMGRDKWLKLKDGDVPDYYFTQCQYQMFVTGIKSMFLIAMTDVKLTRETKNNPLFEGLAVAKIKFDELFAKDMVEKCSDFYEQLINKTPPEFDDSDFEEIKDNLTADLAIEVLELNKRKAEIEKVLSEKKKLLLSRMETSHMKYKDIFLSISQRKGNIDYSKVPQLEGVDLEKYRKSPSEVFKIEVRKND